MLPTPVSCRVLVFWAVAVLLLLPCSRSNAQPGLIPGGGVSVDTQGVVGLRELTPDRRGASRRSAAWEQLQDASGGDGLVYVSLPRVMAQARAAIEADESIPDEVLYLGGLLQVRYVLIDEQGGGLVLAGPGDTIDASDPWRPVGETTGRPLLRLEDLVVALRTFGPRAAGNTSGAGGVFGCSIDMPQGAQQRFVDALNRAQGEGLSRAQKQRRMAQAVGPQTVRFWGVEEDTRFAYALLEADIRMKRLALGLDDSPVRGLPAAVSGDDHRYTRCWFHPAYDPIRISADGQVYELTGPRLALSTSRSRTDNDAEASAGAQRFAERANDRMEALCQSIPAWADLANVIDLAVVATLIRTDRLDEQVGWDLAWALDPAGFPVAELPTPEHVETLVVGLRGGYAAGGVVVDTGDVVAEANREDLKEMPAFALPEDEAAVWGTD